MADTAAETEAEVTAPKRRSLPKRLGKWLLGTVIVLLALAAIGAAVLNSPFGKRLIADEIAKMAPASGLKIEVGRIEGSLYGEAVLHDVSLSDPEGKFLTVPVTELDWRPLSWLTSGLDIRNLTARRGMLLRMPELLPGDPDAPFLPDFDIRIDRFELDDFTLAEGVVDERIHLVNVTAKVDIRDGRAFVEGDGELGDEDSFYALLDAEPDGDQFDLKLDYTAPEAGVIAGLLGADAGYTANIDGEGTWTEWAGKLAIQRGDAPFADLDLTNRAGTYGLSGMLDPSGALSGLPADALGRNVRIDALGTLVESVFDGRISVDGRAIEASGNGAVDLANNLVDGFAIEATLTDPDLFGESLSLEATQLSANLSGPFRDLSIAHDLKIGRLVSGETQLVALTQSGTARYDGTRWLVPLDTKVARVESGSAWIDPRLVNGTLTGGLVYQGGSLTSDLLRASFPGLSAQMALRGDVAAGTYALNGPVAANGLVFDNVGTINAGADTAFRIGGNAPWDLQATVNGRVANVTNATMANQVGEPIRFSGGIGMGGATPLSFTNFTVNAAKLDLALDGRVTESGTTLAGNGTHVDYGPFTVEADIGDDGPRAMLVFASPLPAAGLKDVRVALAPTEDGFQIDTEGQSLLGAFDGRLGLIAPAEGPTRIALERLDVWKTSVTGNLILADNAARGDLGLSGGGLDGSISLLPRNGGQGFDIDVRANNARFAGETPLSIAMANVDASGWIAEDNTTVNGSALAQGIRYGSLFLGRVAASAQMENGIGEVTASLAGRRGSRFAMQLNANNKVGRSGSNTDRWNFIARGDFAGRNLSMPRRAVLTRQDDGGWRLSPSQLSYAGGDAIVSGDFGGGDTALNLQLADMPLSLVDVIYSGSGLGGTISGVAAYEARNGGMPTASAQVKINNLTRSGLVLSSRPADVALSANLTNQRFDLRSVIDEGGSRRGRVQGRITNLRQSGELADRLRNGDLFAQVRFNGPADSLWRLAAIDAFDLTGPVRIAADVRGTITDPRVNGSLASDNLRVRSSLSGTDIRDVTARGSFSGARLRLSRFSGTAPNGGTITGSGLIDLDDLGAQIDGRAGTARGPTLDIRASASNADLLNANGLAATVTGPLRIISNGNGGTIAGRLRVDRASWKLGIAADVAALPNIRTREINQPFDMAPTVVATAPWRYLVDAKSTSRIDVDGMGLDSEWGVDILLRGTTADPRIGGKAEMVRGSYRFAGTRFDLERGLIDFDVNTPIDPRLDIRAETERDGLTVAVNVRGNALQPEITFSSVPALPEEEVLARLLFGGSITELSATDALQLGAALASLRGGGGMDPINQLRTAIGLDRLRIVSADPALNRGTGVALGKNLGKRFYVEIITDGRGYSATDLEFRVTSWISLLASVSTIGRESAVAEISRDY